MSRKHLAITLSVIAVLLAAGAYAWAELRRVHVLEGDAIQIGFRIYSLTGYQTPQSAGQCAAERALATRARARLGELVAGGAALTHQLCACVPRQENLMSCNQGRLCAQLTAEGRDVAAIMIGEGLARPYVCDRWSCPARDKWC